jgi:hypothetical protein
MKTNNYIAVFLPLSCDVSLQDQKDQILCTYRWCRCRERDTEKKNQISVIVTTSGIVGNEVLNNQISVTLADLQLYI